MPFVVAFVSANRLQIALHCIKHGHVPLQCNHMHKSSEHSVHDEEFWCCCFFFRRPFFFNDIQRFLHMCLCIENALRIVVEILILLQIQFVCLFKYKKKTQRRRERESAWDFGPNCGWTKKKAHDTKTKLYINHLVWLKIVRVNESRVKVLITLVFFHPLSSVWHALYPIISRMRSNSSIVGFSSIYWTLFEWIERNNILIIINLFSLSMDDPVKLCTQIKVCNQVHREAEEEEKSEKK